MQLEQAEGIDREFCRCGLHRLAGCDYGKRSVGRSSGGGASGFHSGGSVVRCRVRCHVYRPAGHDHSRSHGEPVDDDD